jgi:precorrin-3B methylase
MGAEMVVIAVGPGTTLGWVLDAQRALARADRAVAGPWLF